MRKPPLLHLLLSVFVVFSSPSYFRTLPPLCLAPKSVSGAAANSQNKNQLRDAVRAEIFHQLDGLALAPLIKALWDEKAFSVFQETSLGYAGLGSVRGKNQRGNRGYIHVAMRALSAYGWFVEKRSGRGKLVSYTLTPEGRAALRLLPEYDKDLGKMVAFIPKAIEMKQLLFKPGPADAGLRKRVELLRDYTGKGRPQDPVERKVDQKLRDQLTGLVLGPVMTALARKFFIAEEAGSPLKYSDPADKSKERKQAKIKKSVFDFFDAQGRLSDLGKIPGNLENLKLAFDLLQVEGWAVR